MIRANFGCGGNKLEGWNNHDIEVDISKPLPYETCSVDEILAEHVFEHISPPDGIRFLAECHRILKHEGKLRLLVPSVSIALGRSKARDLIMNHGHLQMLNENLVVTMLWVAGFDIERVRRTPRREIDGHHRVIGMELDDIETLRIEATK